MATTAAPSRSAPPSGEFGSVRPGSGRLLFLAAVTAAGLLGGGLMWWRKAAVPPPPPPPIQADYEQVDLGVFRKEILVDAAGLQHDHFETKVALLLNPAYGDLVRLRPQVEKRRDYFRHIILNEILHAKTESDLRKPTLIETLGQEIRRRLNAEIGPSPSGQELVVKVIFPDGKLLPRR